MLIHSNSNNPSNQVLQQQHFQSSFENANYPPILLEEVESVIKTSPKNEAAGVDGITVEVIKAFGDTGVMYAKPLEKRSRPVDEHQLSEAQFGFRKNRGCTDAIFALRQLRERSIEFDLDSNQILLVFAGEYFKVIHCHP